jgi:hypothetical protein
MASCGDSHSGGRPAPFMAWPGCNPLSGNLLRWPAGQL